MNVIKDFEPAWQNCTRAIVKSIDSDGQYICDIQQLEGEDTDGEPIYSTLHTNIGFTTETAPFELTQEEINDITGAIEA